MSEKEINQNSISEIEIPKDAKQMTKELRVKVTQGVKDGTIEHKQIKQGIKNLIPLNQRTEEEQKAIRKKGWEKMMEIKGEKKNAKQILDDLLPLFANDTAIDSNELIPNDIKQLIKNRNIKLTQYDLIMLAMIGKAQQGDVKASEYISNHFGDVVTKEVHNVNDNMSESDRQLIKNLKERLNIIDIDVTNNTESDD